MRHLTRRKHELWKFGAIEANAATLLPKYRMFPLALPRRQGATILAL
jgi:hypothetical protein